MRLLALVLCLVVSACVIVPLPDTRPDPRHVRMPTPGMPANEVRRTLGDPDLLDTHGHLLYEIETDREFAFWMVTPFGIPAAAITTGSRLRLHVELDRDGRVVKYVCALSEADAPNPTAYGCIDPGPLFEMQGNATWHDLAGLAGLGDAMFWNPQMSGSNTALALSRDGRLLAAADTRNRVWFIDLDRVSVIGRHDGMPPNALSFSGIPTPRTTFDSARQRAVIAQDDATAWLTIHGGTLAVDTTPSDSRFTAVAYGCCPEGLFGLGPDGASWRATDGIGRLVAGDEGHLRFDARGATVTRPAGAAPLLLAKLDSALLRPAVHAAFDRDGRGGAMLDTRNDFARQNSPANFAFSPDGRWLARNSCRHVELWETARLASALIGRETVTIGPARVLPMVPTARDPGTGECHGPVAFDADARRVAAAGLRTVHLWRVDDGHLLGLGNAEEAGFGRHVVALALADRRLTAVVSTYRGAVSVGTWQTPAGN